MALKNADFDVKVSLKTIWLWNTVDSKLEIAVDYK